VKKELFGKGGKHGYGRIKVRRPKRKRGLHPTKQKGRSAMGLPAGRDPTETFWRGDVYLPGEAKASSEESKKAEIFRGS